MTSPHAETMAFTHLFARDYSLLSILAPEDFADAQRRFAFQCCREIYAEDGRIDILRLDDRLKQESWYHNAGGLALVLGLAEYNYIGDPRSVAKVLKDNRARSEAEKFRATGLPHEMPSQFVAKGHAINELLLYDASPMKSLAEEMTREPELFPTGYEPMDAMLGGGIERGGIFVIAARPSVGKTSLGINIAARAVAEGKSVLFFSLEMPRARIAERALCCLYNQPIAAVRKDAPRLLSQLPGEMIIEDSKPSLAAIQATIGQHPDCDLIVIDYFQLITIASRDSRQFQLEEISNSLKRTATDAKKPMILLAQLNREIERDKANREPNLSDLRGSGALEQDADAVTFLWDEMAKAKDNAYSDAVEFFSPQGTKQLKWILRKNRNGPCGVVDLSFKPTTFTFDHSSSSEKGSS